MKILVALFVLSFATISFRTKAQSADSLYIVTYTTGSAWDASKKPHEQMYFKEHSANLSALRKSGVIRFGARYADKGIIVFSAPTFAKAKELIDADQAIANKLFYADVQRLNVFYP